MKGMLGVTVELGVVGIFSAEAMADDFRVPHLEIDVLSHRPLDHSGQT